MSILINGMDMPKDCAGCALSYYYDGYNGGYGWNPSGYMCRKLKRLIKEDEKKRNYPRPSDCPLVEVPTPHGRLIDADTLTKALEKRWNVDDDQDFANKSVWRELENAPTIIEAEGES